MALWRLRRKRRADLVNSNADGFVLWSFQYAGFSSGSSEWLGRRLGGQGDLAASRFTIGAVAIVAIVVIVAIAID